MGVAMIITTRQEVGTSYDHDRKSQLYASLITFLVINTLVIFSRFYAHYDRLTRGKIWKEDVFALLGAVSFSGENVNGIVILLTYPQARRRRSLRKPLDLCVLLLS